MSLDWPATLPAHFIQGSVSSSRNDTAIRTQMEVGPMKIRRTDTVDYAKFSGECRMTMAQLEIFWAFYNDDHEQGAEPFTWTDPFTGDSHLFVITAMPQVTHLGGTVVAVSFQVEEVPS